MAVSLSQFYQELYAEHLEEAAYLYECLTPWRLDPEGSWQDCLDLEERFEAHLDALVIGGKTARTFLMDTLEDADPGTLFTITCVLCRHKDAAAIGQIWETLIGDPEEKSAGSSEDKQDEEEQEEEPDEELIAKLQAISLALRQEYPTKWRPRLAKLLNTQHRNLLPIIAETACENDSIDLQSAANLLANTPSWHRPKAIRLLGDSGQPEMIDLISPLLRHENIDLRKEAAIALLKLGSPEVLPLLQNDIESYALPLALAGDHASITKLIENLKPEEATEEQLYALGLSGELSAVKPLVLAMYNEELAPAAATACQLILGANLYGDVFIKEEFAEEDLFPEELESFQKGESPKHPAGQDYGENMEIINPDPEVWRNWLRENRGGFDIQQCYVLGHPQSKQALVSALGFARLPPALRQGIADRLAIHHKISLKSFSITDPVRRQLRWLTSISA
ncbi:HEAT repeat domain-containing protein [Hahella ganghwensis]|uniref:HEAT repeat domain-containing protein n=1 Tax=Hahella ganghwensis TaxID=286420 RepID=UPI000372E7A3|nr:HEAT repeat domain-containing protein [Hahella ganghwensis]